jgi:hypothetical protein
LVRISAGTRLITISAIRIRDGTGITIVEARMVGIDHRIRAVGPVAGPAMVVPAMVVPVMIDPAMGGLVIQMGGPVVPLHLVLRMDQSRARVSTKRGAV